MFIIDKNLSYSGPSYPSSPVFSFLLDFVIDEYAALLSIFLYHSYHLLLLVFQVPISNYIGLLSVPCGQQMGQCDYAELLGDDRTYFELEENGKKVSAGPILQNNC